MANPRCQLQFNPKLGALSQNLQDAEKLLRDAAPKNLDLLVLPEMAFTGMAAYLLLLFPPSLYPSLSENLGSPPTDT
jgi:predicted amidohydrolase